MSISVYYSAKRAAALSQEEAAGIRTLVTKYSVDDQIGKRRWFGKTPNWESFCIYDPGKPSEPNVVFEGATKLPDNTQEFLWQGLQHWCALLTEVRRLLGGAEWWVSVDDHEIHWDITTQSYDPAR